MIVEVVHPDAYHLPIIKPEHPTCHFFETVDEPYRLSA
jgi:hypothetical protein